MFDLIAGTADRPLREPAPGSKVASLLAHGVILGLAISIPVFRSASILMESPAIAAFVAPPPAPAPPRPPPPPPLGRIAEPRRIVQPAPKKPELAAPIEMPPTPEVVATTGMGSPEGELAGVAGGVVGGVEGGVIGGVIGGTISPAAPPPPPPPAALVRVGGQIKTPMLLHRVEPVYPDIARAAHISGVVILEAEVGTDGTVETVSVLRSGNRLLAMAAVDALRQWRYTPLVLNDIPMRFVLTVTFNFSTKRRF
jgi:protein TonB